MTDAVISVGEHVIILNRRRFPDDLRRHFIGTVVATGDSLVRVKGHAWVADAIGRFVRRRDRRTRIFSLTAGDVVMVVPADVDVDGLAYVQSSGRILVTDGADFAVDITESGVGGG